MAMSTIEIQPQLQQPDHPSPLLEPPTITKNPPPIPKTEHHIFRSKLPPIEIPNHLPLHTYCFQNLPQVHDHPCLILGTTGKTYTYSETHLISQRTGAGLSRLGIKKGDVIMLLLQNCAEFVFAFMGASMIGAVITTANPYGTSDDIFKQFRSSDAKMIITESAYLDKLIKVNGDTTSTTTTNAYPRLGEDYTLITTDDPPSIPEIKNCLHFSTLTESLTVNEDNQIPSISIDPNDPVALPFSSGTTGLPKGVILTHKNIITSISQQVNGSNPNLYLKTKQDVVLCLLPLFHIYSLNSVLLCSLRSGCSVLIMPKFEIKSLLEVIEKYKVSVAAVVPPLVLALAKNEMVEKYDLSSVRIVLSGAAPLGKELEDGLRRRVPQAILGQGYGMTEAGPVIAMCLGFAKEPFPSKAGSCGTVVRNAEMKVVDPETGSSLGYNQSGEICIRGHQIMKAYLNDDEATLRTIDADGWLHTGDIGYVDDDHEVFIVDRVKELIKYKGFQVPPAEIEALLVTHPSIADAAVIPQKDEVAGEVPVAFVVRSDGLELTEEAVKEFINKQVVFYKRLHKVYFIHAIPKSPAGKILRKQLREKLVSSSSSIN